MFWLTPTTIIGLAAAATAVQVQDIDLTARLDYGTFRGAYSAEYDISYWRRIPYAAPPTGQNRFRAPQPPLRVAEDTTYDSDRPFDMCPQRAVNGSEDCLYLSLYSRPRRTSNSNTKGRPVVVVFHGGAFVQGSASSYPAPFLPPSAYPILNTSSAADLIFIYPNYRLNAFGFLCGREVAADPGSDVNAGLLDQRAALEWTSRHVARFGGDPARVTIWGQSAGGGSVLAHVIAKPPPARGQRRQSHPLFKQALASSPFWPKTYRNSAPQAQERYDRLAELAGCAGPASLACLKSADAQTIRNASLVVQAMHTCEATSYNWGPILDGEFLDTPLSEAGAATAAAIENGFAMYNTHEGESFTPPGLLNATNSTGTPPLFNSSVASFDGWLAGYLPGLSAAELESVRGMYPERGEYNEAEGYDTSSGRAGLVYRDTVLACPAYWAAGAARRGRWVGEYTIPPAKHASDVYWWNTVDPAQKTDPLHYLGYAGAFASFFATGNPNSLKLTNSTVPGVPPLRSGKRWVINSQSFTVGGLAPLDTRCAFWQGLAPKIPI